MEFIRLTLKDFEDNLEIRPYKEIYIFSAFIIETHSDKNTWFYCDMDEMLDGSFELNFYLTNHMRNRCKCLSCPPASDLAFTVYLNKVPPERVTHIVNCYKQLVTEYFIPKKGVFSTDASFEDFTYEYFITSEELL